MKKLTRSETEAAWRALASSLIDANMNLAGLNDKTLAIKLTEFGIQTDNKLLSQKPRGGAFSPAFFLQAIVACGVEEIATPSSEKR